jgi:hypothetical protein
MFAIFTRLTQHEAIPMTERVRTRIRHLPHPVGVIPIAVIAALAVLGNEPDGSLPAGPPETAVAPTSPRHRGPDSRPGRVQRARAGRSSGIRALPRSLRQELRRAGRAAGDIAGKF